MVQLSTQLVLSRSNVYRSPLSHYRIALRRFPFSTKCITCAVGMAVGDLIAQLFSSRHKRTRFRLDLARTARITLFGGLVNGPLAHVWYNVLDTAVLPRYPTHPVAVVTKCLLDQLVMAPLGTVLFFPAMKLMEFQPKECARSLRMKFFPSLMASYRLWPAAHIINFAFVPNNFRVLYINLVAIAWSVALSKFTEDEQIHDSAGKLD